MNAAIATQDRAQVRAAVEARGLVTLMNDTKWRELISAVNSRLPFRPAFQLKTVLCDTPYPERFEEDVTYGCDWFDGHESFYWIEWLRVRPTILRHRGKMLAPQKEDIEEAFVKILCEVGIPHRKTCGCIEIRGYAASTAGLIR